MVCGTADMIGSVKLTSGECLQMSLNADAAILLRDISGSWIQRTNKGTAPASTTAWESSETRMLKFFVTNLDIFDVVLLKQWEVQIYRILTWTNKDSSKTVLYDSHIINYFLN